MRKVVVSLMLVISLLFVGTVFYPQITFAATQAECEGNNSIPIIPKWYKYLASYDSASQTCRVDDDNNPATDLNFSKAIPAVLLAIFEILLRVAGLLAIVFITVGGFQYLTSTGEPDKAKNARTTIINAVVGMMIAMFATVVVNLIGRNIG